MLPIRQRSNQYFSVPFDHNRNYVNRLSIEALLEEKLDPHKGKAASPGRVVLYGLGGSGKTEIAIRFAEKHREDYSAVFWVHGRDKTNMYAGFNAISRMVGRVDGSNNNDSIANAQSWMIKNNDWLLVIDNVDEESAIHILHRDFLRVGMEGDVIRTSRNPIITSRWDGIEVCDMEFHEAAALLSNTAGRPTQEDEAMQAELLSDLGHLPLAIDQAGSYILATGITLQKYQEFFRTAKEHLLNQYPSTQYNGDSRETVMTTWELSFQAVQSSNHEASRLMLILSLFSHDDILLQMLEINSSTFRHWAPNGEFEQLPDDQRWMPDELVPVLEKKLRLYEAIMALRKFSLLRYNFSRESISLHPLVQYWTLLRLASDREEQRLKICSIGIIASNFKPEERMPPSASPFAYHDAASVLEEKSLRLWPWRQYHSLAPHTIRCMQQVTTISSMPESVAHLCLCLLQVLDYTYSGTLLERLFSPSKRLFGPSAADAKLSLLDHLESMSWKFDLSFRLALNIWHVIRGTICPCRKTNSQRCLSCIVNYLHAASWLEKSHIINGTPRIRATALALHFTLNLIPCTSKEEWPYESSKNPFSTTNWSFA